MEFLIIAFRSREESAKFNRLLLSSGIKSTLIPTPKEAGLSCGISVRVGLNNFLAVKTLLNITNFKTFTGVFKVKNLGGKNLVTTIY